MSQPKRYSCVHITTQDGDFPVLEHDGLPAPEGVYVNLSDYAAIVTENEQLRDKVTMLAAPIWVRALTWVVSFLVAFYGAHLLLKYMGDAK